MFCLVLVLLALPLVAWLKNDSDMLQLLGAENQVSACSHCMLSNTALKPLHTTCACVKGRQGSKQGSVYVGAVLLVPFYTLPALTNSASLLPCNVTSPDTVVSLISFRFLFSPHGLCCQA